MNIKKHPHFAEAKEHDLLRPKQFCELTSIPPNYATHLKRYAVYNDDGTKIKVRLTIDNIIVCNVFKKIDWESIKSNFESNKSKNKKTVKTENKKSKKLPIKSKNNIVKVSELPINESDYNLDLHWRKALNDILDVSEQDQDVNTKTLSVLKELLDGKLNPQNIKYITEAYQKLQSIQKDKKELIHKDEVVLMVGTICEFILMGCDSLMKKKMQAYNASQEEMANLEDQFLDLLESAKKELKHLIGI